MYLGRFAAGGWAGLWKKRERGGEGEGGEVEGMEREGPQITVTLRALLRHCTEDPPLVTGERRASPSQTRPSNVGYRAECDRF